MTHFIQPYRMAIQNKLLAVRYRTNELSILLINMDYLPKEKCLNRIVVDETNFINPITIKASHYNYVSINQYR